MEEIIEYIIWHELEEKIRSVNEIKDYGSVNLVYEVFGKKTEYVIRLNRERSKLIEYRKEFWCINKIRKMGIPTAVVYAVGEHQKIPYIIQNRIAGINGSYIHGNKRNEIWRKLGQYSRCYQSIKSVGDTRVRSNLLHRTWQQRLEYNLRELDKKDSLIENQILTIERHHEVRKVLMNLKNRKFTSGLVHGDLNPRNVIVDRKEIYLIDWGTAEINIVPHMEIGILQMSGESTTEELNIFSASLGIPDISKMEAEIKMINLLHRLDKYRWAEDHSIATIDQFAKKVVATLEKLH